MNVIGPRACHQHTGLQLFLDYILKGREKGSKNCMQSAEGRFRVKHIYSIYPTYRLVYIRSLSSIKFGVSQATLRKAQGTKASLLNRRSTCFFATNRRRVWALESYLLWSVTLSCNDTCTGCLSLSVSLRFSELLCRFLFCGWNHFSDPSIPRRRLERTRGEKKTTRRTSCGGGREWTCQTCGLSLPD